MTVVLSWAGNGTATNPNSVGVSVGTGLAWQRRLWVHAFIDLTHAKALGLVYGTQGVNWWYRCMGAYIGSAVTIASATPYYEPRLVTLLRGSHTGLPSVVGTGVFGIDTTVTRPTYGQHVYCVGAVRLGKRALLGAGCVALPQSSLPEDCEVGALSVVRAADMLSPATVSLGRDGHVTVCTIADTNVATSTRLMLEGMAYYLLPVLQPASLTFFGSVCAWVAVYVQAHIQLAAGERAAVALAPVACMVYGVGLIVVVVALKWVLLGRRGAGTFRRWSLTYTAWTYIATFVQVRSCTHRQTHAWGLQIHGN